MGNRSLGNPIVVKGGEDSNCREAVYQAAVPFPAHFEP